MDLTQFKDVLGKPGEGVHFHVAIVDILATILLGYLLARLCKVNPLIVIFGLFVMAEFLHWIFGVDTAFMKLFK